MWELFINPHIDFMAPLLLVEKAKTNWGKVERAIKKSMKKFTGLSQSTPDKFLFGMLGFDLRWKCQKTWKEGLDKWEERKKGKMTPKEKVNCPVDFPSTKWVPKEFIAFNNVLTAMCPKCPKIIMNCKHLEETHNIHIEDPLTLLRIIEERMEANESRQDRMNKAKAIIDEQLKKIYEINS